jgi:hypothetical protein
VEKVEVVLCDNRASTILTSFIVLCCLMEKEREIGWK